MEKISIMVHCMEIREIFRTQQNGLEARSVIGRRSVENEMI